MRFFFEEEETSDILMMITKNTEASSLTFSKASPPSSFGSPSGGETSRWCGEAVLWPASAFYHCPPNPGQHLLNFKPSSPLPMAEGYAGGWGCVSAVECWPTMLKALGSIPSTEENQGCIFSNSPLNNNNHKHKFINSNHSYNHKKGPQ